MAEEKTLGSVLCYLASKTLRIASLGAGAYHGYHDAKGIPLPQTLETTLTYAPALAFGVFHATYINLGLRGTLGQHEKQQIQEFIKSGKPNIGDIFAGACVGGFLTLGGYVAGYGLGKLA